MCYDFYKPYWIPINILLIVFMNPNILLYIQSTFLDIISLAELQDSQKLIQNQDFKASV